MVGLHTCSLCRPSSKIATRIPIAHVAILVILTVAYYANPDGIPGSRDWEFDNPESRDWKFKSGIAIPNDNVITRRLDLAMKAQGLQIKLEYWPPFHTFLYAHGILCEFVCEHLCLVCLWSNWHKRVKLCTSNFNNFNLIFYAGCAPMKNSHEWQ